jgi:hypothetical membrane protein
MMKNTLHRNFAYFGMAGAGLVVVCSLITGMFYRGPYGETYSLLNHFISELGEVGISPLAWLFNLGLIVGGLLLIPFSLGLGLSLLGWLPKLAIVAGFATALALSGVGIFPMNNLEPHITVAMTYFRAGLITVILFGLAIQLQPRGRTLLDKRANWASLIAALCYASFLVYSTQMPLSNGTDALDPGFRSERPIAWPLAVLEWAVFFSTILWFGVIAIVSRKGQKT